MLVHELQLRFWKEISLKIRRKSYRQIKFKFEVTFPNFLFSHKKTPYFSTGFKKMQTWLHPNLYNGGAFSNDTNTEEIE